ncbi:hypothetical protein K432DRAFT_312856 [Lepidopterella palustris CBS 459.81]|uniref:Centromere protein Cenp-K n=1 Tax=Lepidopterella palustris CBS 459.81 TaxID=1314670 RepID=A0A8E2J960_9PEZI|nr:hypothetical protein K432DRAFT_312856 [Lepidopterella palustris CBS 459.81]
MASLGDDVISRIREYATETREAHEGEMDVDASDMETRLDHTLKELQERVKQQQIALEKLRAASPISVPTAPSADPRERLKQIIVLKEAYKRLTPSEPFLPSRGSLLPALIAARTIQQTISGTKEAITSTQDQLKQTETLLRQEGSNLHDANLISSSIENRIETLQAQQVAKSQKTASQVANEMIRTKERQIQAYDSEMKKLGEAFEVFVDDHLAGMLAAEELGGPVVGDMMDVGDDTLAAGFTHQGKAKSSKKKVSEPKRQRRIDEIWGDKAANDEGEPLTERDVAGKEFRELVEELFASLVGTGGSGAYVELGRESAASRFLVRAKIAQFHPKDARKLRLIDFGRELDD